jgi:hypothetical protein
MIQNSGDDKTDTVIIAEGRMMNQAREDRHGHLQAGSLGLANCGGHHLGFNCRGEQKA